MSKTKCEYCGGVTHDDESGNCLACGAPRNEENVWATVKRDIELRPSISPFQFAIGFGNACTTNGAEWYVVASS